MTWTTNTTTTAATPQPDTDVLKEAFAAALLRSPNDPFKCALSIFGSDTIRALRVSQDWPSDWHVLNTMARMIEEQGEDAFLPSKAMLARRVYELGETTRDTKDKLAAFKLYGEIRDFVPRGGGSNVNIQNNVVTQNRVMVVKDHGSDDDWETKVAKQQANLIANART